jgi:hypothetical protein
MTIRTVNASAADRVSAQVFFDTLFRVYTLEFARTLDAFARNGQLTVQSYMNYLVAPRDQLELWEITKQFEFTLKRFTPQVKIGDSYQFITEVKAPTYDLLVVDTPQGLHMDTAGGIHAEHWDFVKLALPTLRAGATLVLYVNKQPYDAKKLGFHGYDQYPEYDYDEWMKRRKALYGFSQSPYDDKFASRYVQLLADEGRDVQSMLMVPCHSDVEFLPPYAFRLGMVLS